MFINRKTIVTDYELPFICDMGGDPGNEFQVIYLPLRGTLFPILRFYFGIKAKSYMGVLLTVISSR